MENISILSDVNIKSFSIRSCITKDADVIRITTHGILMLEICRYNEVWLSLFSWHSFESLAFFFFNSSDILNSLFKCPK